MKTVKDFSLSNDGVLSEKTLMFHSFHFLTIHSLNSLLVSQVMVFTKTNCNWSRDWDGAYETYSCYLHTIGAEHRILTVQRFKVRNMML